MEAAGALLLLLFVCGAAATEPSWDGLKVKWSPLGPLDGFYDVPKTEDDALADNWVRAQDDDDVAVYCLEGDPRVCMLYDVNGVVAGIDICVPVDDVKNLSIPYNLSAIDVLVQIRRFDVPCHRGRVFFVSEDELRQGRSTWKNGVGSGLWFEGKSGRIQIPISQRDIRCKTLFTTEGCFPTMGLHYYYNLTDKTECEKFQPYFLLASRPDDIIDGFGFVTFGLPSRLHRNWFESYPYTLVRSFAPSSPDCLVEWVKETGTIALQIYFKNDPRVITCD